VRIGVLTTSYPRWPGDYAGCFVEDRVRALLGDGHDVEVLAAAPADREAPSWVATEQTVAAFDDRLRVFRLPAAVPGTAPLFYDGGAPEALERRDLLTYYAAARFAAGLSLATGERAGRAGWQAVEAHWLVPSALAAAASTPHLPIRAYAHSGDVALLERLPLGRALARRLALSGADLRFVTAELRYRFARLAGRPVGQVEPLGPAPGVFRPRGVAPDAEARRQLGLRAPTLLAVGRLVPIKGHAMLLRACARVRATMPERIPGPEVVILGDGPERLRLQRLAAELRLPLRLPGFVPRDEVAQWLRAAHLFVQPSVQLDNGRAEGAPVALAEARAVGTPVVMESDRNRLEIALRSALTV